MTEQQAVNVGPSRISMTYEQFGDPGDPPVLLIMGGGAQMISWPDGFCRELAGRGLRVIRFDNRDSGHSTHFPGTPDFAAAMAGDFSSATYTMQDMAADTVGLLDVLGISRAHLVGQSMGGMIAQAVAIEFPSRVLSLTSISSNTGDPAVAVASFGVLASLGPRPEDRDGYVDWMVRSSRLLGSSTFEFDAETVAARYALAWDRDHDPLAIQRQGLAALVYGDRTERLRQLRLPALVMHGSADPLIDVAGGKATAAAIGGAKLVIFDGMGHNLPRELWPAIGENIAALVRDTEAAR